MNKVIILIAIQYAISFFILGWIVRVWKEEDKGRERFWVIKHYWRKINNV